jgi:hypothetical protein
MTEGPRLRSRALMISNVSFLPCFLLPASYFLAANRSAGERAAAARRTAS